MTTLRATRRNCIATYLTVAVLAMGLASLAGMFNFCRRMHTIQTSGIAIAYKQARSDAETTLQRFISENPNDYHFPLLRMNCLRGDGYKAEARSIGNQLLEDANTPDELKNWLRQRVRE